MQSFILFKILWERVTELFNSENQKINEIETLVEIVNF